MEYYHNIITEKSFLLLQKLAKKYEFMLIGGWAVFLYSKSLKSKDIDIIINYHELEELRKDFDVFKNDRLKKYEIKQGETDIDIYLPFYSELGIPAEEILKHSSKREGFLLPEPEILLLLKIYAHKDRELSSKGQKDLLDIFSLLKINLINWKKYKEYVAEYGLDVQAKEFKRIVKSATSMPELSLNEQSISKLKKKILEYL